MKNVLTRALAAACRAIRGIGDTLQSMADNGPWAPEQQGPIRYHWQEVGGMLKEAYDAGMLAERACDRTRATKLRVLAGLLGMPTASERPDEPGALFTLPPNLPAEAARFMVDLLAAPAGENADAERYRFLRELPCCSLSIGRNEHECSYITAAEAIDSGAFGDYADDPADQVAAMKASNTIWSLQIYPRTPTGFDVYHGASLESVIDRARTDYQQEPPA